ncbi:MAG: amino acid permease [Anaerolineales bacterium]|nr:amino acid permease [Anaerolineales bacterium]
MIPILMLIVFLFIAYRLSPRERQEDAHVHGAGQIGLLAAVALFGVDYFTSYYYATGEMMGALHPYGLQQYGYIAVIFIASANFVFGALYMFSLGVFNEGGGSFTAAMRYLGPSLSLIVAVVLIQDYIFTIVVSSLSGVDQLLSLRDATGIPWIWHVLIGIAVVGITWYLTIRGRGESAQVVFIMLALFAMLTLVMAIGLFVAHSAGQAAVPDLAAPKPVSLLEAMYHMLTASMKGLVALSGLEAMSNGIQFVIDDDAGFVRWGKKYLPKLKALWKFYSGKSGIGRFVQTSFLFYGGLTTLLLATFSIRFNVFDGTNGRSLVGNLALIGFGFVPDGTVLFWAYQILAVILLAAASMTAYQDLQAMAWRNVAIGEIPEIVVYRNPKGTFTRPVTAAAIVVILILFLVQGRVSLAVPYYGVGVFLPIMAMGLAIRKHILAHFTGRRRKWGSLAAGCAAALSALIFVGQIVGKWTEGGWVVLISLGVLVLIAHAILISPVGYRDPEQIHRIIREKSRVQGPMGNIVEWQSLRAQEYRYNLLVLISRFAELFGVRRPARFEKPIIAGEFEEALHGDTGSGSSFLDQYLESKPMAEPRVGGKPKETAGSDDDA